MKKVIANNVFKAIIVHVNYHVNYINVVVNMEEENEANVSDTHLCH